MGLFKKIQEEYNKKKDELSWVIFAKCLGVMICFLEWKGLLQEGDWERFCLVYKKQIQEEKDMEWLKKELEKMKFSINSTQTPPKKP